MEKQEKKDYVTAAQKVLEQQGMTIIEQVAHWQKQYNDSMNLLWQVLSPGKDYLDTLQKNKTRE